MDCFLQKSTTPVLSHTCGQHGPGSGLQIIEKVFSPLPPHFCTLLPFPITPYLSRTQPPLSQVCPRCATEKGDFSALCLLSLKQLLRKKESSYF